MSGSTTPKRKMIDIHMHLVPGVDDGAETMEMAAQMLRQASAEGIRVIFATPHSSAYGHSADSVWDRFGKLCELCDALFPDMDIFPGCEVMCVPERMGEICSHIKQAKYPLMGATNYVLAEFPQWICGENTIPCVEALRSAGYRPILAHMERYKHLMGNMALVEQLRGSGAFLQVNAYSLFEEKDAAIRDWAQRLVTEQKVTFLGTDAHRTDHRPPNAASGLKWLYAHCDEKYADDIAWKNAKLLLCGQLLSEAAWKE